MRLAIILLLVILPAASAVEINEIMYNPEGDDSNNEWVELFSAEFSDLSNWTIGDLKSNDSLVPLFIANSSYSVVVAGDAGSISINFSNFSVYLAGPSIGNGLGNSGDVVFLYFNETVVDFVNYTSEFANGNNKTLEKFNSSWHQSLSDGGTPGFENSVSLFFSNLTNESFANETNETTSETNETADPANETQTNSTEIGPTNETTCIASISISTAKEIFVGESIRFRHIVNSSTDFSIIYWIEDLFGNVVREEYETKTLTEKSFTPKPVENDRAYVIKSVLRGCGENYTEKMVIYRLEKELADESGKEKEDETAKSGDDEKNEETARPKFSYELISHSDEIMSNSEANAIVRIISDDSPHVVRLQAYLYRNSKKCSDVAEYEFTIEESASEAVELNFFTNASPGDYNMKIKINKDNQKTDYELRANVTVVDNDDLAEIDESTEEAAAEGQKILQESVKAISIANEPLIYRSAKARSEYLVPALIISILAIAVAVLIWKR